jgi:hypothetical protein
MLKMNRSRSTLSCLLVVRTSAEAQGGTFGRSISPSASGDASPGLCVFLITICCKFALFAEVANEWMEDFRDKRGVKPVEHSSGSRLSTSKEYRFDSGCPAVETSVNAAAALSISVFHCFSSIADDALKTSSY